MTKQQKHYQKHKQKIRAKAKKYRRSPKGLLNKKYNSMRTRSLDKNRPNILIEHLCSRKDFLELALNSDDYQRLYSDWVASGYTYGLIPTVDRKDNTKGYLIDNIQFITHAENVSKGNKETIRNWKLGQNKKKVRLEKDGHFLCFQAGKEACDFLGVNRCAVSIAISNHHKVRGWLPTYIS